MKSRHWNPEDVFHLRVDVEIVARSGKRRRLYLKADRRRVIAAYVALELRTEALEMAIMSRKSSAPSVRVDGVTADELFFERGFQILPSRHPDDGRVGDVVRRGRASDQLRQEAVGRRSVKMIADISAHLAARIGYAGGPMPRFRVEHDLRRLAARSGYDHHAAIDLDLASRSSVNV